MRINSIKNSIFFSNYKKENLNNSFSNNKIISNLSFLSNYQQSKIQNNYSEWFTSYLKFVDEKSCIADAIIEIITQPDFYNFLNNKDTIRILDIGCGNGVLTKDYLNRLSNIFPSKQIIVDALDVNSDLLKDFQENNLDLNSNIQINLKKENFFDSFNNDKKYDLIIASHVMYYTDDISASLNKIKSKLSQNAKALIFHHGGDECILSKLRAKYNPDSPANLEQKQNLLSNNDIIENTLKKEKINHQKKKQYYNLYIPDNKNTQDYRNLISFIIDKPFMNLFNEGKLHSLFNDIKSYTEENNSIRLHNNMYILEN